MRDSSRRAPAEIRVAQPDSLEDLEMFKDILIRFIVGGFFVSFFAILADILKPKSFAGLFGAAPSVALATLILTTSREGKNYAGIEGRSMILGAIAFFVYSIVVSQFLLPARWSALRVSASALLVWFVCSFGLWWLLIR